MKKIFVLSIIILIFPILCFSAKAKVGILKLDEIYKKYYKSLILKAEIELAQNQRQKKLIKLEEQIKELNNELKEIIDSEYENTNSSVNRKISNLYLNLLSKKENYNNEVKKINRDLALLESKQREQILTEIMQFIDHFRKVNDFEFIFYEMDKSIIASSEQVNLTETIIDLLNNNIRTTDKSIITLSSNDNKIYQSPNKDSNVIGELEAGRFVSVFHETKKAFDKDTGEIWAFINYKEMFGWVSGGNITDDVTEIDFDGDGINEILAYQDIVKANDTIVDGKVVETSYELVKMPVFLKKVGDKYQVLEYLNEKVLRAHNLESPKIYVWDHEDKNNDGVKDIFLILSQDNDENIYISLKKILYGFNIVDKQVKPIVLVQLQDVKIGKEEAEKYHSIETDIKFTKDGKLHLLREDYQFTYSENLFSYPPYIYQYFSFVKAELLYKWDTTKYVPVDKTLTFINLKVKVNELSIYKEPNTDSEIIGGERYNSTVKLLELDEGQELPQKGKLWYKVINSDGIKGWVPVHTLSRNNIPDFRRIRKYHYRSRFTQFD